MHTGGVARSPAEVTGPWLTEILHRSGDLAADHRVAGVTYQPVGHGLMSDSFRFHVSYDVASRHAPGTLVGKFAAVDPTSKATAATYDLYRTELRFYQELAPTLDVHTPRVVHADIDLATHDFTLLMEDQSPARTVDQLKGCALEDCKAALRELARLHGPRWNDPHLENIEWLRRRTQATQDMAETVFPGAVDGFLQRYRDRIENEYAEIIARFRSVWPVVIRDTRSPRSIVHTDFRPDNLLFDVREQQGSVVVLDWAGVLHTSGLLDVGYFIGSSLAEDARREHERELVHVYFSELSQYRLGNYDFDACWLDYRRFPFFGLYTGLIAPMLVQRTERSDALFVQMARKFCHQIATLDSFSLWR